MNIERAISLENGVTKFLASLVGKNRSSATIGAYATDLSQFIAFLHETDVTVGAAADVARHHVTDFLTYLSQERGLSGVTRARKLASIREYFRSLVADEYVPMSPAEKVETPKQERRSRNRLRQDEYTRLLSLAGSHPRDYAILTVLLQCGLRVSELVHLGTADIDLAAGLLTVRSGKGQADREIVLEKKAQKALRTTPRLMSRPKSLQ